MNVRNIKNIRIWLVIALIIAIIFVLRSRGGETAETSEPTSYIPAVELISASSSAADLQVTTTGEVESKAKYELRAEISETVRSVEVSIGDRVYAGQPLVLLSSSGLSAQKAQLQAALAAEEAALNEMQAGTRLEQLAIYESQTKSAQVALLSAESSLDDRVRDAYTKADDLVHNTLDTFFYDSLTPQPDLIFTSNDSQTENYLEKERVTIEMMLQEWSVIIYSTDTLTDAQVAALSQDTYDNLLFLREYTDTLASLVNSLTPSSSFDATTIATWKSTVSGMRTAVNAAITTLIASRDALAQAQSSLDVAQRQLDLALAGATTEQLAIQEARVSSAEASLDALQVTINKTYFASPITGTVAEIPVNRGDLVNPGELLVTVLNENSLAVTGFISTDDVSRVQEGSSVQIDSAGSGYVSRVAPSINSQTGKVEIEVAINDDASYIDGQFVNLSIATNLDDAVVPLSAIKTIDEATFVYTVSPASTIELQSVVLGEVLGQYVVIRSGLENVAEFVADIGDIEPGATVRIQ